MPDFDDDDDDDTRDPSAKKRVSGTSKNVATGAGKAAQAAAERAVQNQVIDAGAGDVNPGTGQYGPAPPEVIGAGPGPAGDSTAHMTGTEPLDVPCYGRVNAAWRAAMEIPDNPRHGIEMQALNQVQPGPNGAPVADGAPPPDDQFPWKALLGTCGVTILVGGGISALTWYFLWGFSDDGTGKTATVPPADEEPTLNVIPAQNDLAPGTVAKFDVLTAANKGSAEIPATGVFLRKGMLPVKTLDVKIGVWTIDDITGRATFTPKDDSGKSPMTAAVFVRDADGLESNDRRLEVTYKQAKQAETPKVPPIAKDILVTKYGGVSVADFLVTGKPVTVNVLGHVVKTDDEIVEKSVLLWNASGTPNTPRRDIEFSDEVSREGVVLGYMTATVTGEGVWQVDHTAGTVTFTPDKGFTDSPTILQYTVRDTARRQSNPAKIIVNAVIDQIEDKLPSLVAMDEAAYWTAFRKNVTDVDYDISVVFAVADAQLKLLVRQLNPSQVRTVLGGVLPGARSQRLSLANLHQLESDWANANLDIGSLVDLVLAQVDTKSVNAPGVPLALRIVRLDTIKRATRRVLAGRNTDN